MSIYQQRVEDGSIGEEIHYVKPIFNEEYLIIPKEEAQILLKRWKDITTITNERKYPFAVKYNQSILARMYGGYGTASGGVVPGTEAYFNQPVPPGANSLMGNEVTMTPKQYVQIKEKQNKENQETEVNSELEEFEAEANALKEESAIAEESGKVEISDILKENISEDDVSDIEIGEENTDDDPEGQPVVENTTDSNENVDTTDTNETPIEGDKPEEGTKVPPITIQHSECGHLTFGDEKAKDAQRPRDVGLYGGDSQKLRLFRDGGFELSSSESQGVNQTKGSSIMQVCDDAPLTINSEGDITIRAKNKLILKADLIEIQSDHASEDGVTIMAEHDIKLRAGNNTIITSDNITIDAKERIVSHSEGWQILIGQCIRLHEPVTKLCPAPLLDYINDQIATLKG